LKEQLAQLAEKKKIQKRQPGFRKRLTAFFSRIFRRRGGN